MKKILSMALLVMAATIGAFVGLAQEEKELVPSPPAIVCEPADVGFPEPVHHTNVGRAQYYMSVQGCNRFYWELVTINSTGATYNGYGYTQ